MDQNDFRANEAIKHQDLCQRSSITSLNFDKDR